MIVSKIIKKIHPSFPNDPKKMTKRKKTLGPKAQKKRAKTDYNLEDYLMNIITFTMIIYLYERVEGVPLYNSITGKQIDIFRKYYVGQTIDMVRRGLQHLSRTGTEFDRCYTPENCETAWKPVRELARFEFQAKVFIHKETGEIEPDLTDISDGRAKGDAMEIHYIEDYDSTINGFNNTDGGSCKDKQDAWIKAKIIQGARHDVRMLHAVEKYVEDNNLQGKYILFPNNTFLADGTHFGKQINKFRTKQKKGKVLPWVVNELDQLNFVWDENVHARAQNIRFLKLLIKHGNYSSLSDIKQKDTFTGDTFADGERVSLDLDIVKNVGKLIDHLKQGNIKNYTAEQKEWYQANGLVKPVSRTEAQQNILLRAEWCIEHLGKITPESKRFGTHDDKGNALPDFMVGKNPGTDKKTIRQNLKKNPKHYPEQFVKKLKEISKEYFD